MRAVKRWRYYCEFCPKAGQSGFHMKDHEARCTLNPARVCRMCVKLATGEQAAMGDMLALLPDPAKFMRHVPEQSLGSDYEMGDLGTIPAHDALDDEALRAAVRTVLPALRELTHHCPVCIMAALRQRGIPLPLVDDFDFTSEMKSAWSNINDLQAEREGYY